MAFLKSLPLSPSYIEIVGIITSLIVSVVAVVIAVKTLKQNALLLEESTRPYVVAYNDLVNGAGTPIQFLVIKNFGQTAACIDCLDISPKVHVQYSDKMFKHMKGQIIAPGQSYSTAFKLQDASTTLLVEVTYSTSEKTYHDTYKISQKAISDHVHSKVKPENPRHAQEILAGCFQDYLRSRL